MVRCIMFRAPAWCNCFVGIALLPLETHAPSLVHADAVLPLPVASQALQSVPRRHLQIGHRLRRIELNQLPEGNPLQAGGYRATPLTQEQLTPWPGFVCCSALLGCVSAPSYEPPKRVPQFLVGSRLKPHIRKPSQERITVEPIVPRMFQEESGYRVVDEGGKHLLCIEQPSRL